MMTALLNTNQSRYLNHFIAEYVAKTRTSQARRTQAWPQLADPRSSIGFSVADQGPVGSFWRATKQLRYPLVGARCAGSKVWDVDGNQYVDFGLGFGVHLFGHQPVWLQDALTARLASGLPTGFQSDVANQVARGICELTGAERLAFCNTGTEAVMGAIRVARAATGREKIVVFENSYHGSHDDVVAAIGATLGISSAHRAETIVLPYGEPSSLAAIEKHASELAAVIVEPVQARRPDLQPAEFLHQLRALTTKSDTALVFDDVLVGFRIHQGGCQAHFGIRADLATYGKIIGGGLPIGVLTGTKRFMDYIDGGQWHHDGPSVPPNSKVWFAGTFNKNPLTMAATQAVVEHLQQAGPALQERLNDKASAFATRLGAWLADESMPVRIVRFGSMFRFASTPELTLLIQHLQLRGVYTWEGMVFFVCTAHSDADLALLEAAVKDSLLCMRQGGYIP